VLRSLWSDRLQSKSRRLREKERVERLAVVSALLLSLKGVLRWLD